MLAGRLSGPKVEYGLLPLGALGLTACTLAFAVIGPSLLGLMVITGLMGIFAGFLLVPLNALLQARSPADRRGAVIAFANTLVYAGMLVGSVLALLLAWAGVRPRGTFLGLSLVLLAGFIWALMLVPDSFFRFILIGLANTIYRVRVIGRANVPEQGGALLVPNHVSFADGLFLIASIDRPIRFVVYARVLRPADHGAVPARDAGDPDLGQRRAEADPPGVPRGRPGARRRRHRLHLPRGPAHPDRDDGCRSSAGCSGSSRAGRRRSSRSTSTG